MCYDINEEWKNFISSGHEDDDISDDELVDLNTFIQKGNIYWITEVLKRIQNPTIYI